MAPHIARRKLRRPSPRLRPDRAGYFFPNEVVRIVKLQFLDYRQLRELFQLVARSRGVYPPGRWSRWTFQDLAALRGAVAALGGVDAMRSAGRLKLKALRVACDVLRERYRMTSPLTQARLLVEGSEVIVELGGARFDPDTGQLLMDLSARVNEHVRAAGDKRNEVRALRQRLAKEEAAVEGHGARRTRVFASQATDRTLRLKISASPAGKR